VYIQRRRIGILKTTPKGAPFRLKISFKWFSEKITLRKSIKVTQNGSPFGMEKWVPLIEAGEVFGTLSPFAWMICKRILKKNKL
jgi:hypothetical protein